MQEFLMIQLYGPMASWGDIAVGEQRLTHTHPTKSAIMGLFAAALGIKRDEEDRHNALNCDYCMAVRVDSPGTLLRDYHTVQLPPPDRGRHYATRKDEMSVPKHTMNTILSQRDYRVDALYTVAIYANGGAYSLKELADAVKRPRFTLYLGRKSCPLAFPLQPVIVQAKHLKAAFDQIDPFNEWISPSALSSSSPNKQVFYYWEGLDEEESGMPISDGVYMLHERRDQVVSRKRWQFVNRKEHQLSLKVEG